MMSMCDHCGLKIAQRPAPKEQGGILVDLVDPTGRECYRYWVPAEVLKATKLRLQPCGHQLCERVVEVIDGKAAFYGASA